MTPAEARRIDREEFAADCAAIRQRAYHYVIQRRLEARAEIEHWLGRKTPKGRFITPFDPKQAKPKAEPKRRIGEKHTINGMSLSMREWSEHLGISYVALCGRVHRMGSLKAAVAAGGPMPKGPQPKAQGVVSDLAPSIGTGGGRTAQESLNIGFYSHEDLQ